MAVRLFRDDRAGRAMARVFRIIAADGGRPNVSLRGGQGPHRRLAAVLLKLAGAKSPTSGRLH